MPRIDTLLSNEQWALLNLLEKAPARAHRARARCGVSSYQIRELADDDMLGALVRGVTDSGVEVPLTGNWAAATWRALLKLTDDGAVWVRTNHFNRTMKAIADRALTVGKCVIQAVAVPADDDTFTLLAKRRLITMERADGKPVTGTRPPSTQLDGHALVIRFTRRGEQVIQP